jgi:hypothetical protein
VLTFLNKNTLLSFLNITDHSFTECGAGGMVDFTILAHKLVPNSGRSIIRVSMASKTIDVPVGNGTTILAIDVYICR